MTRWTHDTAECPDDMPRMAPERDADAYSEERVGYVHRPVSYAQLQAAIRGELSDCAPLEGVGAVVEQPIRLAIRQAS